MRRFYYVGGKTGAAMCRSIMKNNFHDSVLSKFTMYGTREKQAFNELADVNNTINLAVRQKFPNFTDDDHRNFMKEYLKHSTNRLLRQDTQKL